MMRPKVHPGRRENAAMPTQPVKQARSPGGTKPHPDAVSSMNKAHRTKDEEHKNNICARWVAYQKVQTADGINK